VTSGNHRLNAPDAPDLARSPARRRHATALAITKVTGSSANIRNKDFGPQLLPPPWSSRPRALLLTPRNSAAFSPNPNPLLAFTRMTTARLFDGERTASVSTPGVRPEWYAVPFWGSMA